MPLCIPQRRAAPPDSQLFVHTHLPIASEQTHHSTSNVVGLHRCKRHEQSSPKGAHQPFHPSTYHTIITANQHVYLYLKPSKIASVSRTSMHKHELHVEQQQGMLCYMHISIKCCGTYGDTVLPVQVHCMTLRSSTAVHWLIHLLVSISWTLLQLNQVHPFFELMGHVLNHSWCAGYNPAPPTISHTCSMTLVIPVDQN